MRLLIAFVVLTMCGSFALGAKELDNESTVGNIDSIQYMIGVGLSNMTLGGNPDLMTVTIRHGNAEIVRGANKNEILFIVGGNYSYVHNNWGMFNEAYGGLRTLNNETVMIDAYAYNGCEVIDLMVMRPELNFKDQTGCGGMYEVTFKRGS
ncbi:MAG: hypothetical protein MUD10_02670 [Candidatus Pacebacteria bacterium]|jgi:hypothetical protein|nr:hypothetical protein [Candidatus Paceibacterota bacterium]